jgi:hypothetical protein
MLDRERRIEELPAVGERVGRDVDDAQDDRAIAAQKPRKISRGDVRISGRAMDWRIASCVATDTLA